MSEEVKLVIATNGLITSIHKDELMEVLKKLGQVNIQRASNVEWEKGESEEGWTVRAAHDPKLCLRAVPSDFTPWTASTDDSLPIAFFPTREGALAAEVKHFWHLLPPDRKPKK